MCVCARVCACVCVRACACACVCVCALPSVCRSGGSDHLSGGPVPIPPKEGIPERNLHRCDLRHQLPAGTHHGH